MTFPLPFCDFQWMTTKELREFDVYRDVTEEEGYGYILECSLIYPKRLHRKHNSFPLAPEQVEITEADLSPYALKCWQTLNPAKKKYHSTKLVATLRNRQRYWCHALNLRLYLELGLELVEIHQGIKFQQKPFLRSYIEMCTQKRAQSTTKAESNMFKLLSNSLYGKACIHICLSAKCSFNHACFILQFIESITNRMDCKFALNERQALRFFSDPLFQGSLILDENYSITFHKKKEVYMKQSWAVGFSILEISKFIMQRFYYKVLQPRLKDVSLCMHDTDSYCVLSYGSSPEQLLEKLSGYIDASNYPTNHPFYDGKNKNSLSYVKHELAGDRMLKFIGLKSKTYAFITEQSSVQSRAKGVKECYKKKIPFSKYMKCLKEIDSVMVRQRSIQAKNHVNMLVECTRVAMSSSEDKRFLLCSIHSCPYGSELIEYTKKTSRCFYCDFPHILE